MFLLDFDFRSRGMGVSGVIPTNMKTGTLLAATAWLLAAMQATQAGIVMVSDAAVWGNSASVSGTTALVGALRNTGQGEVDVYRNLDTAAGTVSENVKLTSSDWAAWDSFGYSVSLSETTGLVAASYAAVNGNQYQGAAYVYRNLDSATGTVTENAKLIASDGAAFDSFGCSASLSGTTGLIGAGAVAVNGIQHQGAAYVYRNLDSATGTVTENAKLIAGDGAAFDSFGLSASLSGTIGLVGAPGDGDMPPAAYVYRNLDTATGTVTENAKLIASDGTCNDRFGYSTSLSGTTGLVGAQYTAVNGNTAYGAAYLYRNLDTATGTVIENVKLTASDAAAGDYFGSSASLSGDQFVIGSYASKACTGSVSSITTLDAGNTSKTISGISFVSQEDWVVGKTTSDNQVTLSAGDTANVTAGGKAVYIGQNAGSNNNTLVINGTLIANVVNIGSTAGNTGNTLQLNSGAVFGPLTLNLATGNQLVIQGDFSNINNLFAYLGSSTLQTWAGGVWTTLTMANYSSLITDTYSAATGYSSISSTGVAGNGSTGGAGNASPAAVPETSTWVMGLLALGAVIVMVRRNAMRSV